MHDLRREVQKTTIPEKPFDHNRRAPIKGGGCARGHRKDNLVHGRSYMGIDDHSRKGSAASAPPLAAFDFDGTLTVRDSFRAFLAWRFDAPRLISGLLRLTPAFLRYPFNPDRGRIKASLVAEFLAGRTIVELEAEAERFAEAAAPRLLRPDALAIWRDWGERGACRVIVTASPDVIVAPFARRLGAEGLLGTRLAVDGQGRITGPLDGPNCRGAEKVARLKAAFGEDMRLTAAYGDTAGDREMLAIAETSGYRVFRARP
jgi:phosphatidylglycerophosphatase C